MTIRSLTIAGLIVLAALTRLLPHPPNFAPITAMAVFGGIVYCYRRSALIAPLVALLLSDLAREVLYRCGWSTDWGFYKGMWVVYGTTLLVALLARLAHGTRSPLKIAGVTLAGSVVFFLVTNFGIWVGSTRYPQTAEGLMTCYTMALPFFRNALLGDAFFATLLFGGWALAESRVKALRPAEA
jgi:hypothetical protein